jgi:hypothetical protein
VRALMVCLIGGKRTRARTLLHHQVRLFLFLERVFLLSMLAWCNKPTSMQNPSIIYL